MGWKVEQDNKEFLKDRDAYLKSLDDKFHLTPSMIALLRRMVKRQQIIGIIIGACCVLCGALLSWYFFNTCFTIEG